MTTEEEKLVLDNINLAYDMAWKYNNKFKGLIELEELQSLCLLGLTKAGKTFNSELEFAFSTYAFKCMQNEILIYYRNTLKQVDTISLQIEDNNDISLEDKLTENENITDNLLIQLDIDFLREQIAKMHPRYKNILIYRLQDLKMTDIAKILNLSQAQISRDYNRALNILRDKFKNRN